jgi:hypothetical protein
MWVLPGEIYNLQRSVGTSGPKTWGLEWQQEGVALPGVRQATHLQSQALGPHQSCASWRKR